MRQREYNRRHRAKLLALPESEWPPWFRRQRARLAMLKEPRHRPGHAARMKAKHGLPQREIELGKAQWEAWKKHARARSD